VAGFSKGGSESYFALTASKLFLGTLPL